MPSASLLFSTQAYHYLRNALARLTSLPAGDVEHKSFPDGERYQRVLTPVADRDVTLVGGTVSDADTLELYDLACTLIKLGARRLTLVVPYFAYATMERETRPGEVVTAKHRARLLSTIPTAPAGNRILLLDLHSEGIPYYFEGPLVPTHVYGKPLVSRAARTLARQLTGDESDFVLASTDAGRAKWVESLANDLRVPAAFVYKRRLSDRETEVSAVSAAVQNRLVIIYDDMIRSGSSLLKAAEAYKNAGARILAAITTHALLPDDALERLRASNLFTSITATDSHPRARTLASDFLHVHSCAELFTPYLV